MGAELNSEFWPWRKTANRINPLPACYKKSAVHFNLRAYVMWSGDSLQIPNNGMYGDLLELDMTVTITQTHEMEPKKKKRTTTTNCAAEPSHGWKHAVNPENMDPQVGSSYQKNREAAADRSSSSSSIIRLGSIDGDPSS